MLAERAQTWELLLQEALANSSDSWLVRCYNRVDSTMDHARDLVAELVPGQIGLVLAAQQSKGRGRLGAEWRAAESGFYATYVLLSSDQPSTLSGLSLMVGCVVAAELEQLGCPVGLKWPNDILAQDGRKLCGVLIEVLAAEQGAVALIGIGINLSGAPDPKISVSFEELSGRTISQVELAARISLRLAAAWGSFRQHGFKAFRSEWQDRALFLGKRFLTIVWSRWKSGTDSDAL